MANRKKVHNLVAIFECHGHLQVLFETILDTVNNSRNIDT